MSSITTPVIIRSTLLDSTGLVRTGMSTRYDASSGPPFDFNLSFNVGDDPSRVRLNRERFFGSLGISLDRLAIPKQVHSNTVMFADHPGGYDNCDALVTNTPGLSLCVSVADCLPVFLHDPKRNVIALVHAGWRGTAAGISENALELMKEQCGTDVGDVCAFIGPGAADCCYETGVDVAARFSMECVRQKDGKHFLDLKAANRMQLVTAGVDPSRIEVSPLCTISDSNLFHSYRRDGKRSGRMMAVMELVGGPGIR